MVAHARVFETSGIVRVTSFIGFLNKVHRGGIPWDDAGGDSLRDWPGLDRLTFFDDAKGTILPTGSCYPGARNKGGDNPPRPERAPKWHERLLNHLPDRQLTLLVGQYAHRYYLKKGRKTSTTEAVRAFSQYRPQFFPLPHPSWRSLIWVQKIRGSRRRSFLI
ncbi:MAG: uracil-DNA glycosylase family protein [Devosia sp.]